jgi:uncharacterized protein (TIGR02996 family)
MDPVLSGLLHDVETNSGDETPWLVLADWLEDHDEPERAELTRLSIPLRRPIGRKTAERTRQENRLRDLVARGHHLLLPRRTLVLSSEVKMELVLIPAGGFRMGSLQQEDRRETNEGPTHKVRLSRGFWLGIHPVTEPQWQAILGEPPRPFQGDNLPVSGVSWNLCRQFLRALKKRTGSPGRFPTEAEWEYACRGLTSTAFSFGSSLTSEQANFDGNYPGGNGAVGPWLQKTTPVGSYPPNAFGVYDMHGNVWEWCHDWFADDYYRDGPGMDPTGPETGGTKVLRGGSWYSYGWSCRSANREQVPANSGSGNYGCRVAMDA